jgi:hypothetical protein
VENGQSEQNRSEDLKLSVKAFPFQLWSNVRRQACPDECGRWLFESDVPLFRIQRGRWARLLRDAQVAVQVPHPEFFSAHLLLLPAVHRWPETKNDQGRQSQERNNPRSGPVIDYSLEM